MNRTFLSIGIAAALVVGGMTLTGCKSRPPKQQVQSMVVTPPPTQTIIPPTISPEDGELAELERQIKMEKLKKELSILKDSSARESSCQFYDDDEWFYATGVRQFKASSINTAPTALLRSTQLQMRQKLQSIYRAVTRDYFDQMNTDKGSYADEHIESAGDLVVKAKISDTYEVCRKQTQPDANGNITMYMAIKVSKKQFIEDVVKEIKKDKEMEVRFKEKQFRESAFKVFEDSNNKEYNQFQNENTIE